MTSPVERFVIISPGKDIKFLMTPASDGSYAVDCPGIARFYVSGDNSVNDAREIIIGAMHSTPNNRP